MNTFTDENIQRRRVGGDVNDNVQRFGLFDAHGRGKTNCPQSLVARNVFKWYYLHVEPCILNDTSRQSSNHIGVGIKSLRKPLSVEASCVNSKDVLRTVERYNYIFMQSIGESAYQTHDTSNKYRQSNTGRREYLLQ